MLTRTTSTILSRRTSSLTLHLRRKTSGIPQASQSSLAYIHAKPRFPVEILEIIIGFVLWSSPRGSNLSVISLSRTSKALREIALRLYYREVFVDSRALFGKICFILSAESEICGTNAYNWVRSLFVPSFIIVPKIGYLGSFTNLRDLEVCLATEGLGTQDHTVHLLMNTFFQSPSGTNLTKLSFSAIPRIDTQLLALIAKTFPRLTIMELTSTERADYDCCLPCLEDSLRSMRHSPLPDHYSTVEKLATSFADALAPLDMLENVYFGIYLSDADIFEEHVAHAETPRCGRGVLADLSVCPPCEGFLKETHERERVATTILANALPSLLIARWDTLFAPELRTKLMKNESEEDGFYFRGDEVSETDLRAPYISTFIVGPRGGEEEIRVVKLNARASNPILPENKS